MDKVAIIHQFPPQTVEEVEGWLKELHQTLAERNQAVRHTKDEIKRMLLLCYKLKYGIEAGSIVQSNLGEAKIVKIETHTYHDLISKPWLRVNIKKANGEWGTQERAVYDQWEVIK